MKNCEKCGKSLCNRNKSGICRTCLNHAKIKPIIKCNNCGIQLKNQNKKGLCRTCLNLTKTPKEDFFCKTCGKKLYKKTKTGCCSDYNCWNKNKTKKRSIDNLINSDINPILKKGLNKENIIKNSNYLDNDSLKSKYRD